jgi:hypothetical protein
LCFLTPAFQRNLKNALHDFLGLGVTTVSRPNLINRCFKVGGGDTF